MIDVQNIQLLIKDIIIFVADSAIVLINSTANLKRIISYPEISTSATTPNIIETVRFTIK